MLVTSAYFRVGLAGSGCSKDGFSFQKGIPRESGAVAKSCIERTWSWENFAIFCPEAAVFSMLKPVRWFHRLLLWSAADIERISAEFVWPESFRRTLRRRVDASAKEKHYYERI